MSQGKWAIVDDADYHRLATFDWHYIKDKGAARSAKNNNGEFVTVYMHKEIMKEYERDVLHLNDDVLDNRRNNLVVAYGSEVAMSRRKRSNTTSKYKGVYWSKDKKKWRARISLKGKTHNIGLFANEEDAALAYNKRAEELFGIHARLNNVIKQ